MYDVYDVYKLVITFKETETEHTMISTVKYFTIKFYGFYEFRPIFGVMRLHNIHAVVDFYEKPYFSIFPYFGRTFNRNTGLKQLHNGWSRNNVQNNHDYTQPNENLYLYIFFQELLRYARFLIMTATR